MRSPEDMIKYLINEGLMRMRYDKVLDEQMVDITEFGIEVNTVLSKLKSSSKESEATNQYAADKLEENE